MTVPHRTIRWLKTGVRCQPISALAHSRAFLKKKISDCPKVRRKLSASISISVVSCCSGRSRFHRPNHYRLQMCYILSIFDLMSLVKFRIGLIPLSSVSVSQRKANARRRSTHKIDAVTVKAMHPIMNRPCVIRNTNQPSQRWIAARIVNKINKSKTI